MKKSGKKFTVVMSAGFVITILLYIWFVNSTAFINFKIWSDENEHVLFISLIFLKILGIVWPPIPAGVLTLGSIPIIGWVPAYLADITGSIIGSIIAYGLGRKYGVSFLRKVLDDSIVDNIRSVKIKKGKEFEGIFFLRIFGGTIVEVVVYAAGLFKVKFQSFVLASIASHLVVGLPTFFLAEEVLTGGDFLFAIISAVVLILFFTKFKNRYFEN